MRKIILTVALLLNSCASISGKSLAQAFDWLTDLNTGLVCAKAECDAELKPSPKGTVIGFW
ncbi:MAG: hypothetical protein H7256_14940 [Bdellovibrio sp.]|nr:hypothetical protein [Bdellovibrio sp.]